MENVTDNTTSNYSLPTSTLSTILSINNLTTSLTSELTTATSHFYNDTTTVSSTTASTTTEAYTTLTHVQNATRQSWNITKVGDTLPKTATTVGGSLCTTTLATTTTEENYDEFAPPEGVEYIFVPLGVMLFVIVLSAVVIIISRRRKMERLRHRLMPLYNFDPGEEGEDDWETELLDEGFSSRQRRQGYQSMDSEENADLFSTPQSQNLG
ncbi:uncharacterized protein C3orf18 homolog isoform X2 [Nasonia vitripennis]|nr:uncharacterized protein C3orf18 homolog isoform X2 [Nasonia vitripennis]